jgi:hypothetical protein
MMELLIPANSSCYDRLHAGVQPKILDKVPAVPLSAFEAAVKEYEETSETEDCGDEVC